jgi:hypothetical protein
MNLFKDEADIPASSCALLSKGALADWNRPEEEAAWAYLQLSRDFLDSIGNT